VEETLGCVLKDQHDIDDLDRDAVEQLIQHAGSASEAA
jgi:hypothetical protein